MILLKARALPKNWLTFISRQGNYTVFVRFIFKVPSGTHLGETIDIIYTLDSASNYSAIQKLKPWLQTQDIPMKWEDSYVFYFLNRELKH
jgi:hypothetical protein